MFGIYHYMRSRNAFITRHNYGYLQNRQCDTIKINAHDIAHTANYLNENHDCKITPGISRTQ